MVPWDPRSSSLVQVNSMLREQLEQANVANAALSEDIRKLTADWARARDELEQREAEWRREEEVGDIPDRDRDPAGSSSGCEAGGCGDVGSWRGMWSDGGYCKEQNLGNIEVWHVMGGGCKAEGYGM